MKVVLAADHRGFALKEELKQFLVAEKYEVEDVGAHMFDPNDDYPDFALPAAEMVAENPENRGIFVCGSGMGMDVVANKVRGVRASMVHTKEMAVHARNNDNINVATLPADVLSPEEAKEIVLMFLRTPFSVEAKYARRIAKIEAIEDSHLR